MRFHPGPDPLPPPRSEHPAWRWLLLASAAVGMLCSITPWICVQFSRLWGSHDGPPGWQSSAGFTCLCSSALVVVLTLVETDAAAARQAVRPGTLLLAVLSALVVAFEWYGGPGTLRGVSATWTIWFYTALACTLLLLVACTLRFVSIAGERL